MRWLIALAVVALTLPISLSATPAHAGSPVPITFGVSWDGPGNSLQDIVNSYVGSPGLINVHTDYVGAKPGDLDPWFWVGRIVPALLITEIAGNKDLNVLGWYKESGGKPVIDGVDDGIVFTGSMGSGQSVVVTFPGGGLTKFGFWLDPRGARRASPGQSGLFFTNRFYNDIGPGGTGALHAPFDGDVQALVFDVSKFKGPNTWLVCFEDIDAGLPITPCCSGTDNDFNDMVFQVTALGATPTQPMSFGRLKALYR